MTTQLSFLFPPAGARFISLTRGMVAIVDAADFERVSSLKWHTDETQPGRFYASSATPRIRMHRFILDAPPGLEVDHINHDTLDNRRANLRVCTRRENARNVRRRSQAGKSSQFKGVCWDGQRDKWRATINAGAKMPNGKARYVHLGRFDSELDAALAYAAAARRHFGPFAAPNLPANSGERAVS